MSEKGEIENKKGNSDVEHISAPVLVDHPEVPVQVSWVRVFLKSCHLILIFFII
jgi:hypothetical protein